MVQGSIGDADLMTRVNQLPAWIQAAARYSPLADWRGWAFGWTKR